MITTRFARACLLAFAIGSAAPSFAVPLMDLRAEDLLFMSADVRKSLNLTPNQQTLWNQMEGRSRAILRERQRRREALQEQAKALGIGKVLDRRGAGRRDVDNAGIGQRMLQSQTRSPLLGRRDIAALALTARGIGHGVRLVEHDHAIKIRPQPVDYLVDTRLLAAALLRAQRRIGGEEHAFIEPDIGSLPIARERGHQQPFLTECRPVALGVFEQPV